MRSRLHPYACETVIPQLAGVLGSRVVGVAYHTLLHETSADEIASQNFYFGGEIALTFDAERRFYISWDSSVPYGEGIAFGLLLSAVSVFSADSVECHDASQTPLWSPHMGCKINGVELYGYSNTPFVLCLATQAGKIYSGTSYQSHFGDGDDVLATDTISGQTLLSLLWSMPIIGG